MREKGTINASYPVNVMSWNCKPIFLLVLEGQNDIWLDGLTMLYNREEWQKMERCTCILINTMKLKTILPNHGYQAESEKVQVI